jgi:hypothetical protein
VSGTRIAALVLTGAAMFRSSAAFAQSADPPPSRVEIGIGGLWIGRQPLGQRNLTETAAAGTAQTVFSLSSELAGGAGFAGRAGVRVTRSFVVEAEGSYIKPQLRIALSGDTEGAAPVTAIETIQQFTIGGGVLWYVPVSRTPHVAPFVTAGGGYLRQLHEQATLADAGRFYQVGGGISVLLVTGRHLQTKGIGARLDARAVIRSKGVAFDGGSKTSPAAGLSAFVRF